MKKLWIVVANSSSAHMFNVEGKGKHIEEVQSLLHPEGRAHGEELNSDRHHRGNIISGSSYFALGNVDAHHNEEHLWAKEIADILASAYEEKKFEELIVGAPPEFLGELRRALSFHKGVESCITKEIDKDFPEHLTDNELIEDLRATFDLWNK